jgi:hypothetical protein
MQPLLGETIQRNCDISDARDNGIYSICTLVLKLRNLYKWEQGIEPWDEPESSILLDWIETKEKFWETITDYPFQPLCINNHLFDPWDIDTVNAALSDTNLVYGAGYGRSLKAIFFLAEKSAEYSIEGCPVLILGREKVKELSSPVAMLQNETIYIRKEQLRFFFWDQIQEIRSSCKSSFHHALAQYDVLTDGQPDREKFKAALDTIVETELDMFVYHEVGERLQNILNSDTLKQIIGNLPGSPIEFVGRAIKDILADTHPRGMLNFIIQEKRNASLGFYVGFLDGLRKMLSPGITDAFQEFLKSGDWLLMDKARRQCLAENKRRAEQIRDIAALFGHAPLETIKERFQDEILTPIGIIQK